MPVLLVLEVKLLQLREFAVTLHQGTDSAGQRFKGRGGLATVVLRRTVGAFKARDGLIQKNPTMKQGREPALKEIKEKKTKVGEAMQENMP